MYAIKLPTFILIITLTFCLISCDEENNTPDPTSCLWVVSFSQTEGLRTLNAGGTYNFIRQINNDGPNACSDITLRYFLSTDEVISNSDTYLNVQESLNLASGAYSVSGINLTIPSNVTAGKTYYIGVLINNASCNNNCSTYKSYEVTISGVTPSSACLWIPNWHLENPHDGHNVTCGQTYTFHREVANDGPSTANNIKIRYYLSTDNTITTSDTYLGVEETLNLANGGRSYTTIDLAIPSGLTDGQTYYVGILITSSSCTNTCTPSGAWNVTVSCTTPPNTACLWIPNWHLENPHDGHNVTCGQTYTFHREIANDGPSDVNDIKVRYYLSTDNTITTSDTYLGVEENLNLANGGRSYTTVDLPIPSGLNDGQTYYVGILISSSSCTNTCTPSGAWNVTIDCPTGCNSCLWIPNWHLENPHDGHEVTCGQTYTFHREVANDGPSAADNIKVRYYLSTDNNITTSDTYLGVEETLNLANGGRSYTTVNLPIPSGLNDGQTYYVGILITSSSCTNTCTPSGAWNVTVSCGTPCTYSLQVDFTPAPDECEFGNCNGKFEPNEDVAWAFGVINNGNCKLTGVYCFFSCPGSCDYVSYADQRWDIGDAPVGQSKYDAYAFLIKIDGDAPNGWKEDFRIRCYSDQSPSSPLLTYEPFYITISH